MGLGFSTLPGLTSRTACRRRHWRRFGKHGLTWVGQLEANPVSGSRRGKGKRRCLGDGYERHGGCRLSAILLGRQGGDPRRRPGGRSRDRRHVGCAAQDRGGARPWSRGQASDQDADRGGRRGDADRRAADRLPRRQARAPQGAVPQLSGVHAGGIGGPVPDQPAAVRVRALPARCRRVGRGDRQHRHHQPAVAAQRTRDVDGPIYRLFLCHRHIELSADRLAGRAELALCVRRVPVRSALHHPLADLVRTWRAGSPIGWRC